MRVSIARVCVWSSLAACWAGASLALAAEELNTAFVSKDAVGALVLHPQRDLTAPELELLPIEVIVAACQQHLGFDPREVELAVGLVSMTGLPMGQPGLGAVLHFSRPYDREQVMAKLGAGSQEATHADKKYYRPGRPNSPAFALADEKTLLIGTELQIKSMLAAEGVDSPLVKLLKSADQTSTAVAVVDLATLRPLVQLLTQNFAAQLPEEYREFLELPKVVRSIEVRLDIRGRLKLDVVLGANDAAAGERIEQLIARGKVLGQKFIDTQMAGSMLASEDPTEKAMGQYLQRVSRRFLDGVKVVRTDDKVQVALIEGFESTAMTGMAVALVLPAVQAAREAGRRNQSVNELKQIGIALLNHHDTYRRFPPQAITDKDGQPLLSWRVKILPFLDQQALYKEFHLDEPWNSEHNQKLLARMPDFYRNPNIDSADSTVYLGVAGKGTFFGNKEGTSVRNIIDGTSKTITVVEADAERAVPWTKPEDWEFNPDQPRSGLGGLRPGIFSALFADAHVAFISNGVDPSVLKGLFTIAGREQVNLPE